jgi:hypothetical protein
MQTGGIDEREPRFTFVHVVFNSYHDEVRSEVERQSRAFAEDLGDEAVFMEPFEASRQNFADQVRSWSWPDAVNDRMETEGEPIILVVRGRFTRIDPQENPWAIIWLSDFEGAPYNIKPLFQKLAREVRKGTDILDYLGEVAERRKRRGAIARAAAIFSAVGTYVEWTPTIPFVGVSIDVKAILSDIAEAAATH